MALYQVGDLLDVITSDDDEFEGRVRRIDFNAADGSGMPSEYEVEDHNGGIWHISDNEVMDVLDGPTFMQWEEEAERDLAQQNQLTLNDMLEAEDRVTERATEAPETPPLTAPLAEAIDTFAETMRAQAARWEQYMMWGNPTRGETVFRDNMGRVVQAVPQPEPEPRFQFTARPVRGTVGTDNTGIGFDAVAQFVGGADLVASADPAPQPIDPEAMRARITANTSRGLTTRDYNPQQGDVNRVLYRFPANIDGAERLLVPILREDGRYRYRVDNIDGTSDNPNAEWVNNHQYYQVSSLPNLADRHGVMWTTWEILQGSSFTSTGRTARTVLAEAKKPRKKLRRKQPIPEIKDEKHYASKDFIA